VGMNREPRRARHLIEDIFRIKSTPCFFNKATNSSSNDFFLWCASCWSMYRITVDTFDELTLNAP
jgi:hypothetical protein